MTRSRPRISCAASRGISTGPPASSRARRHCCRPRRCSPGVPDWPTGCSVPSLSTIRRRAGPWTGDRPSASTRASLKPAAGTVWRRPKGEQLRPEPIYSPPMIRTLFRQHVYPGTINPQIHGLRGLAALIVFVFHIYGIADEWHFWPASLADFGFVFRLGRHGVEIFFIISGCLITASLLRHQRAGRFLVDRCIRIYPVFLTIHLL